MAIHQMMALTLMRIFLLLHNICTIFILSPIEIVISILRPFCPPSAFRDWEVAPEGHGSRRDSGTALGSRRRHRSGAIAATTAVNAIGTITGAGHSSSFGSAASVQRYTPYDDELTYSGARRSRYSINDDIASPFISSNQPSMTTLRSVSLESATGGSSGRQQDDVEVVVEAGQRAPTRKRAASGASGESSNSSGRVRSAFRKYMSQRMTPAASTTTAALPRAATAASIAPATTVSRQATPTPATSPPLSTSSSRVSSQSTSTFRPYVATGTSARVSSWPDLRSASDSRAPSPSPSDSSERRRRRGWSGSSSSTAAGQRAEKQSPRAGPPTVKDRVIMSDNKLGEFLRMSHERRNEPTTTSKRKDKAALKAEKSAEAAKASLTQALVPLLTTEQATINSVTVSSSMNMYADSTTDGVAAESAQEPVRFATTDLSQIKEPQQPVRQPLRLRFSTQHRSRREREQEAKDTSVGSNSVEEISGSSNAAGGVKENVLEQLIRSGVDSSSREATYDSFSSIEPPGTVTTPPTLSLTTPSSASPSTITTGVAPPSPSLSSTSGISASTSTTTTSATTAATQFSVSLRRVFHVNKKSAGTALSPASYTSPPPLPMPTAASATLLASASASQSSASTSASASSSLSAVSTAVSTESEPTMHAPQHQK
ncbi:uncharacterized protein V1518DRAFT_420258 [Limtongia smithiae]|uniref:uncharacterized protein n=1 Tax=Limtongia smithiae TaxID=1125753 RepID=UPI0034CE5762